MIVQHIPLFFSSLYIIKELGLSLNSTKQFELSSPYCIVCHDAGAGNILLSREQALGFPATRYILSGPSLEKWKSIIPRDKQFSNLEDAFLEQHSIVTGTGWSSRREHDARKLAKAKGVYCYALIDHWVNYSERFSREDETILPDEIIVSDDEARQLAEQVFPNHPISQMDNYYLLAASGRYFKAKRTRHNEILYILEPVHEDWGGTKSIDEEFQALNYFCEYLQKYFEFSFSNIRLRLHPSETKDKYQSWVDEHPDLPIEFDTYSDIESSIANADWVFGCESYGLIVALECGKEVYSTIPHWAPLARLPHKQLRHIRDVFQKTEDRV